MSKFGNYLGELNVKIGDDIDFNVVPALRHKQKLLGVQKNAKKGLDEEDWTKQHEIFLDILKTADIPEEEKSEENLKNFLLKHDMDFMMVLYVGFGWAKKEDLEGLKEKMMEKSV